MFQAYKLKYISKIYSLREDKAMTGNIVNRAEAALTGKTVLKKTGRQKIGDAGADIKDRLEKKYA